MSARKAVRVDKPCIREVLDRFLTVQEKRLAAKTFADYAGIISLLQHSLDGYGPNDLDAADDKRYHELVDGDDTGELGFCDIFGPQHILPHYGEFLGYFMVRKVMAGKETLRYAGTVTKKLAKWLVAEGYAKAEDGADGAERAGAAARELPLAEELAQRLNAHTVIGARPADDGKVDEGQYNITKVEKGRIWLEDFSGAEFGPIALPAGITKLCQVGWEISGALVKTRGRWSIIEAWNVYP